MISLCRKRVNVLLDADFDELNTCVFFILNIDCQLRLDSGNTDQSPIPYDLKGYGADQTTPESPGAEVLTNRKNALTINSEPPKT